MLTLNIPEHSACDTFTTCISRIRNPALKARLKAAIQTITNESEAFDKHAKHYVLHKIVAKTIVAPDITSEEMEKVYTDRMAKASSPGRSIYDDIIGAALQGRCPLCGQRTVSTLDHVLPKAHYPALAVTPSNLVPACIDCNKAKLASLPRCAEEVVLHPYYDDLGGERWLFAEVVETQPAALRFTIVPSDDWDDVLVARVSYHFATLKLGVLYASEAAEELVTIRYYLKKIHTASGIDGVRDYLYDIAVSCNHGRPNGWRSAAYHAWAESDWFCNDGFEPAG